MPKKGFETCKEIRTEMLSKFPKGWIPRREIENIIGRMAGIDERTINKYFGWLRSFDMIIPAKDADGKICKNSHGDAIFKIQKPEMLER
ncbi:MAG: hypothetical protein WA139_01045 [Candidatus Aenigmatarchaeota archaeon]